MSASLKTFSLTEYEANIGSEGLNELLDSFSCPVNPEVENFSMQNRPIDCHDRRPHEKF